MKQANQKLTKFDQKHGITPNMGRRDFIKNVGSKSEWKKHKKLEKDLKKAKQDFEVWDERANITQGIIDKWQKTSPNLFQEVDKQTTDFLLSSESTQDMRPGVFGSTKPTYINVKGGYAAAPYMTVKINEGVNVDSEDYQTGEFSLNHEAGHFLYIVKFTDAYIKFYLKAVSNGTYVQGGHGPNNESGKVAKKYGATIDISSPPPKITKSGN
jgi:hypothetical protein